MKPQNPPRSLRPRKTWLLLLAFVLRDSLPPAGTLGLHLTIERTTRRPATTERMDSGSDERCTTSCRCETHACDRRAECTRSVSHSEGIVAAPTNGVLSGADHARSRRVTATPRRTCNQ